MPEKKAHGNRPVTSYDVAKRAGVSQSAVSRCYKTGASVSPKTREKVRIAAEALGYQPNALARSLITARSNIVAVIISNLTNLYYPEVLAQISRNFSDKGIHVLLFALETEGQVEEALEQIWQYQVDGVVAAVNLSLKQTQQFERRGIPLLFYNRHANSQAASAICCDQAEGGSLLTQKLIDYGHKRFALIKGPSDSVVGQERENAVRETLAKANLRKAEELEGDFSYDGAVSAIHKLMAQDGDQPDAIVCANDVSAIGAIDTLRNDYGVTVPEEISVAGFDGVGPSKWMSFDLTTIRQPVGRMTKAAVDMMLERIEEPNLANEKRVFSGIFIEGGSARLG